MTNRFRFGGILSVTKDDIDPEAAPTWVYFLAARASSGIGRKDLAKKYARLVADAKGDSKLLRDWKERIKRSGYLK